MLSFKEGRKIAKVYGGRYDGEFIYLLEEGDGKKEIKIPDGIIVPLPQKHIVEKLYVSAPSGAGKSTFVGNWLIEARRMFKKIPIYVFSSIKSDPALDPIGVFRVPMNADVLDSCVPEELKNSIIVLDDTDTIQDKEVGEIVEGIRDWILEQGRHFNERIIITSHLLMNHAHTRRILNEATAVCFFPRSGATYPIKRFLKEYVGLEQKMIEKILKLPSRWVCVYKTYPMYILHEHGAFLIYGD